MQIPVPLQIPLLLALIFAGVAMNTAACGKTYSPHKLLYVDVNETSVDPAVETMLAVLRENGFTVKDVGSEHPLTPESRAMRRLFVAKHHGGAEVVINNFFTPRSLHVSFYLMESKDVDTLQRTYAMILHALERREVVFREVSEAERYGGGPEE